MVWESHDASHLANGQIPNRAVIQPDNALTTGNTMDACLDRLGRTVKVIRRMAWVLVCAWPADVV